MTSTQGSRSSPIVASTSSWPRRTRLRAVATSARMRPRSAGSDVMHARVDPSRYQTVPSRGVRFVQSDLAPACLGPGSPSGCPALTCRAATQRGVTLVRMPVRSAPAIRELLADGRQSFSFEFMPPKTQEEEERLWKAIRQLEPLRPTFVSVTYGAGGSTRDRTVRVTGRIAEETTLTPVGHLTAVSHSVAEIRHVIGSYAAVGVQNVLALRGDPPGDPTAEWVAHPQGLRHAAELVRLVRDSGEFCVGVAAFPEGHNRAVSKEADIGFFVDKCAAGADFAITQMFFYVDDYLRFADEVARRGCSVPVIAGIIPITSVAMIDRAVMLSGAKFPPDLAERLHEHAEDRAPVRKIGVEYAAGMCQRLLDEGLPGLHFYTLNTSRATKEIYEMLGLADRGPAAGAAASLSGSSAPITM